MFFLFYESETEACPIAIGRCGHHYHLHCIEKWAALHHTCPYDNKEWEQEKQTGTKLDELFCPICRNSFVHPCAEREVKGETEACPIATGSCGHQYHLHCIEKWTALHHTCPLDNKEWKQEKPIGTKPVKPYCTICRLPFDEPCSDCLVSGETEACPIATGRCGHQYHLHCIEKWLALQHHTCPYDEEEWVQV